MPNPWQQFFDSHAPYYDQNPFAQHTVQEVDFFLSLFPLLPGASILDMGCGTGRHAVELAKRGYQVTGVDISAGMLAQARKKAEEAGVAVEWVQADATKPLPPQRLGRKGFEVVSAAEPLENDKFGSDDKRDLLPPAPSSKTNHLEEGGLFDAAISLCEGGFGLIAQGEDAEAHDLAILKNIAAHLKPAAPFLLTALNGYQVIRQMKDEHVQAGRFDPATMVSNYEDQFDLPEGPKIVNIHERLFIPPEMVKLLAQAGLRCDRVFGGTAGSWGQRPLSLDEIEVMYVCRKA